MSGRVLSLLLLLATLLATATQGARTFNLWQASAVLHRVEVVSSELGARGRLSRRVLYLHIRQLTEVASLDPTNFAIPMAIGSQYLLLQDPGPAISWYQRAQEIEPRPEIYLNLARAQRLAGDEDASAVTLAIARRLDPHSLLDASVPLLPPASAGGG